MNQFQNGLLFIVRLSYFSFCSCLTIVALCQDPVNLFSYHPVLMTWLYACLTVEGLVTARHMQASSQKPSAVFLHFLSQTLGAVIGLLAFAIVYWDKHSRGKNHFLSWHARSGLATLTLHVAQLCFGLYLYNFSALCSLKGREKIARLMSVRLTHRLLGILTFCGGMATLVLGFQTNWAKYVEIPITWSSSFVISIGLMSLAYFSIPFGAVSYTHLTLPTIA